MNVLPEKARIMKAIALASASLLFSACNEEVTDPRGERPARSAAVVTTALPAPFTARAPLDAFFINQPSEMMIRSDARMDFAIQRLVTPPGAGAWHTHNGPSFGIVESGQVMITRYTKKGCVSTTYGPGEAYYEVANEVHRATVLGADTAVEYKARFYTAAGAPFGIPANDPGCGS